MRKAPTTGAFYVKRLVYIKILLYLCSMEDKYKIVSASNPTSLGAKVRDLAQIGWKPVGSHQAVTIHAQNRYAGKQHMDTTYKQEYTQTLMRD